MALHSETCAVEASGTVLPVSKTGASTTLSLHPHCKGGDRTLLQAIKELPIEIRNEIFIKLLEFGGPTSGGCFWWPGLRMMPNLIIALRPCSSDTAIYKEIIDLFYRETRFHYNHFNNWQIKGFTKAAREKVRHIEFNYSTL